MDTFNSRRTRPGLPGFWHGITALGHSMAFLWKTPGAWLYASVPVALCASFSVLAVVLAMHFVPSLVAAQWPQLTETIGWLWASLLSWLITFVAAFCGVVLATMITPPLSAPALEKLIRMREDDLGAPPRPTPSLWREFKCALQAQLLASAVFGPILAVLWLITLLAPQAALVTVPLKFIALAFLLAWSQLDYPLSLRGVSVGERLRMLRRGVRAVFGFGITLAVLFAIPFATLLILPVAVTAATELSTRLLNAQA